MVPNYTPHGDADPEPPIRPRLPLYALCKVLVKRSCNLYHSNRSMTLEPHYKHPTSWMIKDISDEEIDECHLIRPEFGYNAIAFVQYLPNEIKDKNYLLYQRVTVQDAKLDSSDVIWYDVTIFFCF